MCTGRIKCEREKERERERARVKARSVVAGRTQSAERMSASVRVRGASEMEYRELGY